MADTNILSELAIEPDVAGVISCIPGEGDKGQVEIDRIPFHFPGIGTRFWRVSRTASGNTSFYFVKKYEENIPDVRERGILPWTKVRTKLPPAQLEQFYLAEYRKKGCSVPLSKVIDNFTIVMDDCGEETLEKKLRGKSAKEQEEIFALFIQEQAKIAVAGRRIEVPKEGIEKIKLYSDLERGYSQRFRFWQSGGSEEDKKKFLEATKFLREYFPEQYFLGDNSTFHILFKNEKPVWIDLEKLKKGHQSREYAGIYLSPESIIALASIEKLLYLSKRAEAQIEQKEFNEEEWVSYLKCFYKGGVDECFRRGTRINELQMLHNTEYKAFIGSNLGFLNAFERYKQRIEEIDKKMRTNGLYSEKEKENFGRANEAILSIFKK